MMAFSLGLRDCNTLLSVGIRTAKWSRAWSFRPALLRWVSDARWRLKQ